MATGAFTSKEMSFMSLEVMKQHFFFLVKQHVLENSWRRQDPWCTFSTVKQNRFINIPLKWSGRGGPGEISKKQQSE